MLCGNLLYTFLTASLHCNLSTQAIHNASSNGWAAPAAAAVFVGAGATYYFTMRTPMAGIRLFSCSVFSLEPHQPHSLPMLHLSITSSPGGFADSATETPELLDPNQVKGGTAPSKTVPLPDFTATDHTGSQFTLDQIKVCSWRNHDGLLLFASWR